MTPFNLKAEFHSSLAASLFGLLLLVILVGLACFGATVSAFGTDAGLCYRLGLVIGGAFVGLATLAILAAARSIRLGGITKGKGVG